MIPNNYAVVDISSSGKTRIENGIVPIEELLTAKLVLYENVQKIDVLGGSDSIAILKSLLNQRPKN